MQIQFMTDGGADVPGKLSESLDLISVPLYLNFQGETYKSGTSFDLKHFYQKIKDSNTLPQSSAPSPHDFYEAYQQVDPAKPILMLSMSKGLSSTFENAVAGKNRLLEEQPDRQIEVINTKTASCGLALLLHEADRIIKEGHTFAELIAHMQERVEQTTTLFVLKTLENLILGGRLDKVKGTIAKTLNIKLLMHGNESGSIEVTEKVRGDKKSIRRFIEQIGEYTKNMENKIIAMSHCNAEERAKTVMAEIRNKYPFQEALLTEMGPLISTYSGEGGLVISFFKD
ncbi:DegV family protein [Lentibacillus sp. N15]|uniref:DegV family protein n=1 Tax=Lentibacillus songyuanensis TaxID=3136161 RepID=UPI0031B9F624